MRFLNDIYKCQYDKSQRQHLLAFIYANNIYIANKF